MDLTAIIHHLKSQRIDLNGWEAHKKLTLPDREQLNKEDVFASNPHIASVLIVLFTQNNEVYFPLILRNTYKGAHSAQIGFPGGRIEPDETLEEAGIRETFEEIGLHKKDIHIIQSLSSLYIPVSHFLVHPFIAYIEKSPEFILDPKEVQDIYKIKLSDFLQTDIIHGVLPSTPYNIKIPHFDLTEPPIWGATAMILQEFKELLLELMSKK